LPSYKTAETQLQAFAKKLQDAYMKMQEDYNKLYAEFEKMQNDKATLKPLLEAKYAEIADLEKRMQKIEQSSEQQLVEKQAELLKPLEDQIMTAIKAVAKEGGYTYIFDSSAGILLYSPDSDNVMPLVKKKSVASFADNTSRLHDAIRDWIRRDWDFLKDVRQVYIEHQPVLKNPVMKTVQLLIFATLRERFLGAGQQVAFHFVHAGKKVKGAAVGDAGYKDRKAGGEDRAKLYLGKFPFDSEQHKWLVWWQGQHKKDDLADTLCMCLDAC
jgi:outer membrane protein